MKTHSTLFSLFSTVAPRLVAMGISSSLLAASPLTPPIEAQASLDEAPISAEPELALDPEAALLIEDPASLAVPTAMALALALDPEAALPIEDQASPFDGMLIPMSLVLPLDPLGRPSPVCSQCRITTKTAPRAGSDAAFTSFTFADEIGEGFEGSVTIEVSLVNDDRRMTLYENSLSLDDGEPHLIELHSDPYHFAWADVAKLSIALSPAM